MERWVQKEKVFREVPEIEPFLSELKELLKKHNLSLGHQDIGGAFIISKEFDESYFEWIEAAMYV